MGLKREILQQFEASANVIRHLKVALEELATLRAELATLREDYARIKRCHAEHYAAMLALMAENSELLAACEETRKFLLRLRTDLRVNHLLPVLAEYSSTYSKLTAAIAKADK